ncbi:hypothetical protein MTO96_038466 [Rhipicephalus appendiculatus]
MDVLTSMLEISDKWGWPCLFEFYTEGVRSDYTFELHLTGGILRRYTHTTGGGISHGVTFEEMVGYEVEIMNPVMSAYFLPPETFVYQRDPSDTSGMWERWATTIARHYDLKGNELVEIITTKRQYFHIVLELHQRICLSYTLSLTGIALFGPFVQRIYTEPVRQDVSRIASVVRRTVYQTLGESTYPWLDLSSAFIYFDTAVAHDLEARYSHFPDMEASFVKNQRDATKAHRQTNLWAITPLDPSWVLVDDLYQPRILGGPSGLRSEAFHTDAPPMYHVSAPTAVRLGTFGVEVAKATVHTYELLRYEGHNSTVLDRYRECLFTALEKEASGE